LHFLLSSFVSRFAFFVGGVANSTAVSSANSTAMGASVSSISMSSDESESELDGSLIDANAFAASNVAEVSSMRVLCLMLGRTPRLHSHPIGG